MNTQEIQGQWGQLRGKLKEKWGQLTNDDLQIADGNVDQMMSKIQQRTGQTREAIEDFIEKNMPDASTMVRAKDAVMEQVQGAADTVREGYEQVAGQFSEGYGRAEGMVRQHPGQSMAAMLGTGLVAGVIVGLLMCSDD